MVACIYWNKTDNKTVFSFYAAGFNSGNNSLKGCGECNTIRKLSPANSQSISFVAVDDVGDVIYGYTDNSFLIHFVGHSEVNE